MIGNCQTMTASTPSPVSSACLIAQRRAALADCDPSTPTTIRPVFPVRFSGIFLILLPGSQPNGHVSAAGAGSAQLPQERIPRLGRHDADSGVGRQGALGFGDNRIQVKL